MNNREIAREMKSLCQLDIDAVHAYTQALEHIEQAEIRDQISICRSDHERHISDLSDTIRSLGEESPEFSKDFKGFILEAFTKIRGITGTEGALKALKSGEEMTNWKYGDASAMDLPIQIRELVERNYDDEKRHLAYVDQAINERLWEKAAV